jgi:hypothetical protein
MIGAWGMPERALHVLQAAAVGAYGRPRVYVQQSLVVLLWTSLTYRNSQR